MLGLVAGALTTAAFAPQLLRSVKTGSTTDISLAMLLCVNTGMALWLAHGLAISDIALILANTASLALAIPLLILKLKNDCGCFFRR